jgi:uncharacterized protein (DUF302 family)
LREIHGAAVYLLEAEVKKSFAAEYVECVSDLPFESVIEAFEKATGSVEDGGFRKIAAHAQGLADFERLVREQERTSGFMRFLTVDHGAWVKDFEGGTTRSKMYTIGNPLIARTMLRHEMAAGLNVPVRVHIFEDAEKKVHFGYHLPSSLMSVYGNAEVMKACEALDSKLDRLAKAVTAAG